MSKDLSYYMNLPYEVRLFYADDCWYAKIDLLNCLADGETKQEALQELEIVKELVFEAYIADNEPIPEPQPQVS